VGDAARYRDVNVRVFDLYEAGRHREALGLLESAIGELEPWVAELAYLQACLLATTNDRLGAVAALQDAVGRGGWWDPDVLTGDDDLASLRGMPPFEEVLQVAKTRWQRHNASLDRSGDVLVEAVEMPVAVLVALHGAEEDALDAVEHWGTAADSSMAVLGVRSSQRVSPNYRTWPDADRAVSEISDALRRLPEHLTSLPIVAAGFSAGGRVALNWALTERPQAVTGVIAMAPAISLDTVAVRPELQVTQWCPARLLVGEQDSLRDQVTSVAATLSESGFAVDVVPGCGHEFPVDFGSRLARLLTDVGRR
jgi:predicted esterase